MKNGKIVQIIGQRQQPESLISPNNTERRERAEGAEREESGKKAQREKRVSDP